MSNAVKDVGERLMAFLPNLRRFAISLCGSRDVADDLVQSACERALASAERFEPGTRFDAWIFRILRNLWIDQVRRQKTAGVQDDITERHDIPGSSGERETEARLTLKTVAEAITELPDEQREVVLLVCVEELSLSRSGRCDGHSNRYGHEPTGEGTQEFGRGCRNNTGDRTFSVNEGRKRMTRADFSDEILMRFADGELDTGTAAEVERAMETDDALVARVALFIETRHAAKAAMEPLLDEPVPSELKRAVERMVMEKTSPPSVSGAGILPFPRRAANESHRSRWLAPVAASLAAVVAGFGGYWLRGSVEAPIEGGLGVAAIGSPALDEALATVAAGEERRLPGSDQRFRAIATFRDNAQALCREFELDSDDRSTVVSVACRAGSEWRVTFAVIAPGATGGYAPASSTETLDAYLTAIDAGAPLEAAEEARALSELQGAQR